MPWCDDCAKFWNPSSMRPDGQCPICGRVIVQSAPPPSPASETDAAGTTPRAPTDRDEPERPRAPWHFKLMMVALVIYLAFRFVQGVGWVMAHH